MTVGAVLINSLWAGLYAGSMTVVFSAPWWAVVPSVVSGFVARLVRDALLGMGVGPNLAVLIAATVAVTLSGLMLRRSSLAPVVLVSGLIPLGAATALLRGIVGLWRMSSLQGEALADGAVFVAASFTIAFNTTVAIAMGFWLGMALVGVLGRKKALGAT